MQLRLLIALPFPYSPMLRPVYTRV